MREILFRGKDEDSGLWCYGDLSYGKDGKPYIRFWGHNGYLVRCVLPETVGQFTGFTDKNNKRIFEGDILEFDDVGEEGYEYKEGFDYKNRATVVFSKGRFELGNFMSTNSAVADDMVCFCHEDFVSVFEENEVIGNIYDNPELLEVKYNV